MRDWNGSERMAYSEISARASTLPLKRTRVHPLGKWKEARTGPFLPNEAVMSLKTLAKEFQFLRESSNLLNLKEIAFEQP